MKDDLAEGRETSAGFFQSVSILSDRTGQYNAARETLEMLKAEEKIAEGK